MSTNTVFDLVKLYKTYFTNTPYFIEETHENPRPKKSIDYSGNNIAFTKIGEYGQAIWFPVTLKTTLKEGATRQTISLEIEACTVAVNLTKEIIRTQVSERKGRIKECFSIDDYRFTIKGFLIGKNRLFPEGDVEKLKQLFESTEPVELHGGYPELFLDSSCRVAISALDFPEVQGKATWIRPFTMTLETDYIEDLVLSE